MKRLLTTAATLAVSTGAAYAGGLDRSGSPVDIIFQDGNYAELSFGYAAPKLTGRDVLGNNIADVGDDFLLIGAGIKLDVNEKLSFSLILDEPYGAGVEYGGDPATTLLGGTLADASSTAFTALAKYNINDRISVYAGPRRLEADGEITLSGAAYGPANGYNVQFESDGEWGYVLGAAYEIPDIALRVALTYHSSIDLNFDTMENIAPGLTTNTVSEVPQSVALNFQTGVAPKTLLFGGIRWTEWSAFTLAPTALGGNLAELDDSTTYSLGVGRQFTDNFAATASITYEDGGADDLVSPLAPTNGSTALSIGGRYNVNDNVTISGGIRYTWLGDAMPETGTPDVARASFTGNDAISVGMKIGYSF